MAREGKRADRRVAVTGVGVVSPIGSGTKDFWSSVVAGRSGVDRVRGIDSSNMKVHCAAEVRDFDLTGDARHRDWPSGLGRTSQLALVAADMAVRDADIRGAQYEPRRVAIVIGTTVAEARVAERRLPEWKRWGLSRLCAHELEQLSPGAIATTVARALGFRGPAVMLLTSCTAGNYAVDYARQLISSGRVDAALAGGADALSKMTYVGFHRLLSLAAERCQPFDKNRQGLILGEGAAFLFLEETDRARRRGARLYGEVIGHGYGFDAHHMTAPHPDGLGGEGAIRAALREARLRPEDVDYVSAHGTGTVPNDRIETKVIKKAFGDRAYSVPVSSIKSMIGHTMGAASSIEAVTCLLAMKERRIPPTINYETPDPECDLDYVANRSRARSVRVALSLAFAFGGSCSALVLREADADATGQASVPEEDCK